VSVPLPAPRPTRAIRVIVIGAGFGTANCGVAALASGTLTSIYHAYPRAHVALLDYARKPVTHEFRHAEHVRKIPMIALRFSKNPFQRNHVVRLLLTAMVLRLFPARRRARLVRRNDWLGPIARAHLVGALSGGDSFSSLYGLRRLLYVSLPQLLVLAVGRPLILLPQSYGPFHGPVSRFLAGTILRRAERIFSREESGLDVVHQLAPAAAPRSAFAYDLGFALEPRPAPAKVLAELDDLLQRGPVVGLNVSGLLFSAGSASAGAFGLRENYPALMRGLVTHLVSQRGCAVVLIPHVLGRGGESDISASLHLLRELPPDVRAGVYRCDAELDHQQVKHVIAHCHLLVASRMHACIAALSQLVPAVALGYSDKFRGVLGSVGAGDLVIDLRQATREEVIAAVDRALDARSALAARLESRIPAVRDAVLNFFVSLRPPPFPRRATPVHVLAQSHSTPP